MTGPQKVGNCKNQVEAHLLIGGILYFSLQALYVHINCVQNKNYPQVKKITSKYKKKP